MANKKTRFVYLQGKTKWFRHLTPDPWGNWKHVLYPNAESITKIHELQAEGLKNVLKKDEDGYFITLRRPTQKLMMGKVVGFAPPEVLEADGVTPFKDNVGNGSDITTKLEVYEHKTPGGGSSVAGRWMSTKIDNLVPFDGKKDFNEDEEKAVRGLDQQPAQW